MSKTARKSAISRALSVVRKGYADGGSPKEVLSETTRSPVPEWLTSQLADVRDNGMPASRQENYKAPFPVNLLKSYLETAAMAPELTPVPSAMRFYDAMTDPNADVWTKSRRGAEAGLSALPFAGAAGNVGAKAVAAAYNNPFKTAVGFATPGMAEMVAHTSKAHAADADQTRSDQIRLRAKGLYKGKIDGVMGKDTAEALAIEKEQQAAEHAKAEALRADEKRMDTRLAGAQAQAAAARAAEAETQRKAKEAESAELRRTEGAEKLKGAEDARPWWKNAIRDYAPVLGYGAGIALGTASAKGVGHLFDKVATAGATRANALVGNEASATGAAVGKKATEAGIPETASKINQFWAEGQRRPMWGSRDVPYVSDPKTGAITANTKAPSATELYLTSPASVAAGNAVPVGMYGLEAYVGQEVLGKKAEAELVAAKESLAKDPSDVNIAAYHKALDNVALAEGIANMGRLGLGSHMATTMMPRMTRDRPDISKAEQARFELDKKLAPSASASTPSLPPGGPPTGGSGQPPIGSPPSPIPGGGNGPMPPAPGRKQVGSSKAGAKDKPGATSEDIPTWVGEPPAGVTLKKDQYWDRNLQQPRHKNGSFGEMPRFSRPKATPKATNEPLTPETIPNKPPKSPEELFDPNTSTGRGLKGGGFVKSAMDTARQYADGGDVLLPRRSDAMVDHWLMTRDQPSMRTAEPRTFADKASDAISSGLDFMGVDGRTAADYGHRGAGLVGTPLWPGVVAHDASSFAGEGIRDGRPSKVAAAGVYAALSAALPAVARRMMRMPSFEAINDARMAKQLNGVEGGWKPSAFDRKFRHMSTHESRMLQKEQQMADRFGEVRPVSDVAGYIRHPGFEPEAMNKAGGVNQMNSNTPLPQERLRMLYPNFAEGGAVALARQYANGGGVDSHVHSGPIVGHDGGRADTKPITVPAGAYIIPADVVSAFGGAGGNTLAGMKALEQAFGRSDPSRASGGAVPIKISDGEFVVAPDQVARVGGGDVETGHRNLDDFVRRVRADHIKTLSSLPGPAQS